MTYEIDEIGLRINHYFKVKEAVFSPLGYAVIIASLLRQFFSAPWSSNLNQRFLISLCAQLDNLMIANLILLVVVFALAKGFLSLGQSYYPR